MANLEKQKLKELKILSECCRIAGPHPKPPKVTKQHSRYIWNMFERFVIELEKLIPARDTKMEPVELKMLFDICMELRDLMEMIDKRIGEEEIEKVR